MANAKKKCRHCKEYDLVESGIKVPLGWFCSMSCVVQHGKKAATAVSDKRKRQTLTKLKESVKTASDLPCISCDATGDHDGLGGYWDAGHYRSRGAAKHLSFNLWNCAKQCSRCNRYLSGNVVEYRKRLITRIGSERVDKLENNNDTVKHDITYLRRIKQIFKNKLRIKKKLQLP